MKKLFTLLFAALFANQVFAQTTIFFEDFEVTGAEVYTVNTAGLTGAPEWDYENTLPTEGRLRMYAGAGFAKNGTQAATMDRNPSGTIQINYLILNLDMSAYTTADSIRLNFSYMDHGDETSANDAVWVRGNNAATWINIYNLLPGTTTNGVYNDITGLDISAALAGAGQNYSATFQIRFGQEDNFPANTPTDTDGITFDDIEILGALAQPIDAGITQITSPVSGCGSAVYEDVTVVIRNFGLDTIFTLDASYTVNGGAPVTENVSTTILPGNNFTYTFASQANLGTFGTYNFDAWTTLAGDTNNFNDSITNYQVVRDSIFIFAENICIYDVVGGAGNCNFTNDICNDGNDFGDLTLKTSPLFVINTTTIDSITFYLYYSDCGFSTTDFTFYLNGTQIGTFTNTILECVCTPSLGTCPYIFSIADTAVLNAALSDTNTLSVQHNGPDMAVAGYTATVYSQVQCPLLTAIEVTNDTVLCIGDSVLLSVSIIDSVALIPPYSYLWSPSTGLSCDTCQSPFADPSSTITYTILVTDSIGVQDSALVTVTVFPAAPIAGAGTDTTICEGDAAQLNASGGASYLWTPGTELSDSTIAAPLASPSITTTYILTASNACGSDVDSVTVSVNQLPIITVTSDTALCPGDSVQLSASGGVSYSWNPTSGLDNPNIANPIANPSVTTTYIVAVTSDSGCVNFDSVIVLIDSVAQIVATAGNDTICLGDTTQLNVGSLFTCDDYNIDNITFATVSGSGTSVFLGDDQVSTALPIGFTFNFYCNDYSNFYISSNGFLTFNSGSSSGCCSGQFLPTAANPNNLVAFAWTDLYPPGNGSIDYFAVGTAPNRKLVMNFTGIPFFSASTPDVTTQVILYETTNIIEIHTTSIATGSGMTMGIENFDGTIAHVVSGRNSSSWSATNEGIRFSPLSIADTSLNYTWTPSTGLSNPNIIDPLASPSTTTTYVVEAAVGSCSSFDTITIYVDTVNFIAASPDTAICLGDSVQLSATGSGAYLWSPSTGLSCTNCQSPYASPATTTTYYVTTPSGCSPTDSVTVSVGGGSIIASSIRDSICPGDTTQLFAYSCEPELFYDGFEDGTYNQWTDAGGGYTIAATNTTAAVGNYSLQLTGGNFSQFDGVYTTFNPGTPDYVGFYVNTSLPFFSYDAAVVIGDDNTQTNGGIMSFYADWSGFFYMNGITNLYNANQWYHVECKNIDFINKTFDYYIDNVLITPDLPFNDAVSTYISQIHLFNFDFGSTVYYDEIIIGAPCSGIDTTLSYTWTPAAGLSNPNIADPIASPSSTTTYTVAASSGGCTATDTVTIYTTALNVTANTNTSQICSGDMAQLSASSNIEGTSYSWGPAAGLSCINCPAPLASPSSTTMYYVTATSGSCIDVDSVLLTVGTGPIPPSCTPITTAYCCGMGIYNVTFNTINNTTPDGIEGYQDYSCTNATNVIVDLTYPISVQTGTGLEENVRVWIDYNNDGVFDNDSTTELVFWSDNVLANHSGNITIPFSAVINTPLRMRVGSDYYSNPPPQPCINVEYGQFEDYTVIVLPNTIPPVADFNITVLDMCQGIVSFTDQSLYNPTSWLWDFGDGSGLSTSQNPFYAYSLPGTYTVTLIVTNPFGSDTISQQIVINSLIVDFTVSNDTVNIGQIVNFFDNSTGADSWNWDFGDGFFSTNQNPSYAYFSEGTFTVTLTVTNTSGCIAQIMTQIVVIDCAGGPQTGSIIGPDSVNEGAAEFYSATFHIGSIYNWTVIGGNQTAGGQSNFITVQWATAGIGQVIVVETDSMGCIGDAVVLIVNIGSTGINEFNVSGLKFKVYPNPTTGEFILELEITRTQDIKIEITNTQGQVVFHKKLDRIKGTYKETVDFKPYSRGIYFLQLLSDKEVINKKIILQ